MNKKKQAGRRQRKSRTTRLNRLILDSLPCPALLVRRDRTVLAANRMAREMGAAPGTTCWRTFAFGSQAREEAPATSCAHSGSTDHCMFCRLSEAFERSEAVVTHNLPALNRKWDIYWLPLDPGLCLHYAVDVTTHDETAALLRQERDRAQQYLDVAGALMVVIGADQRVGLLNRTGCELLGCKEGAALGKNWFDAFIPERIREGVRAVFEKLIAGEIEPAEHFENPVLRADGSERLIAWHNTVIRNDEGRVVATLSSGTDITEQRQAELQLQQTLAELERSNRDLEQFSYVVSHELKEPLVTIGGFARLLARRYKGKLDEQADDFLHRMIDGIKRMEQLIAHLLAYARIRKSGEKLKPVACSQVLERALANLSAAVEGSRAKVTAGPLPIVAGNASLLTQLFQNLISNAIKFCRDAPPVVHVEASREGQEWQFAVRDNGIGIPAEHRERIFEMFERLHRQSEFPGSGVGLATCKKIVERHGGRIWVASQPGRGSTFHFTLPCLPE